ncbi:MAG TPA: sulfite exporter TauE/SafE family protein [Pirellulales bacterium]|nr:sulfite exporter TauE/SafE family protein [Pirellulales bacterium]
MVHQHDAQRAGAEPRQIDGSHRAAESAADDDNRFHESLSLAPASSPRARRSRNSLDRGRACDHHYFVFKISQAYFFDFVQNASQRAPPVRRRHSRNLSRVTATWLCLFGAVVGMLSGVLGIGGGIVLVPGLMLLFEFNQREAQGTSLAVLSMPVAIAAAVVYYRNGYVHLPVMAYLAGGFVVGAFGGANLVPYVPVHVLRPMFGLLLLYVGFLFVLDLQSGRPAAALPALLATMLAALLARLLHRRMKPHALPAPPSAETEYHI